MSAPPSVPKNWRDRLPSPAAYYGQHVARLGKPNGDGWAQGQCPFHEDRQASLSINLGDGAWLLEVLCRLRGWRSGFVPYAPVRAWLCGGRSRSVGATKVNAVLAETPQDAARRLAVQAFREGFQLAALHSYYHASGEPYYWRIRAKHPDGRKWIRPMQALGGVSSASTRPAELPAIDRHANRPLSRRCARRLGDQGLTTTYTTSLPDQVCW